MDWGAVFYAGLEFQKRLSDPVSGDASYATTWEGSRLMQNVNDHDVAALLAQITDKFIDEYLRVNAPACEGRE